MTQDMIRQYSAVVDFLGKVLGPDYEVALYDFHKESRELIAIANGKISGKTVGNSLPDSAIKAIDEGLDNDCLLNKTDYLRSSGKAVRTSAMIIRDSAGKAVGLLSVNFDDSRFLDLSCRLLHAIHPENYVSGNFVRMQAEGLPMNNTESVLNDIEKMLEKIFEKASENLQLPVDRLNHEEKLAFTGKLCNLGFFDLKGSVSYVAEKFGCSVPTMYRYINSAKNSMQ